MADPTTAHENTLAVPVVSAFLSARCETNCPICYEA